MPIAEGLPNRPHRPPYCSDQDYIKALESYIDEIENRLDIELFNSGM